VIEQKLNHLATLLRDVNRPTPPSSGSASATDQGDEPPRPAHSVDLLDGLHPEPLEANGGPHRTVQIAANGSRPWDQVLHKLDQLNDLLESGIKKIRQTSNAASQNSSGSRSDSALPFLTQYQQLSQSDFASNTRVLQQPSTSRDAIAEELYAPSEEESNVLFRSWLWSVYPIHPIFSPRLILEKFTAFHKWYRNGMDIGMPNPDPSFMPFVYLVWYTGTNSLSEKGWQKWFPWVQDKPAVLSRLRAPLEQNLATIRTQRLPSVYSIATAVIYQSLTFGAQDVMINSTSLVSTVRSAQNLGLHIERSLKQLSDNEAEMRRRLWWEIVHLDASNSAASNVPVVMDECYTNVDMIKELKQFVLGTNDATEYERCLEEGSTQPDRPDDPFNNNTTSLVSVYHLVARARYALVAVTKRLLKANMQARPMAMSEMKELRKSIQLIGKDTRATIDRIQTRGVPELDFTPEVNSAPGIDHLDVVGEPVTEEEIGYFLREGSECNRMIPTAKHHRTATISFHKWARIHLSMMVDQLECISYAPFLKNSNSRLWAVARNCALKACHSFMRKFISLGEDIELQRFRWTRTSMYQPIYATVILLVDLHDRPHSEEAPRSRAMIDKIFSLSVRYKTGLANDTPQSPFEPPSLQDGGSEVWIMLCKLRRKAWQKAGLDPDVLWSEEDQVAVGVAKPLHENELFARSLREDIILKHKERQARLRTNGQSSTPRNAQTLVNGTPFQSMAGQYLHPSELSPGEQLNGPILQELAELEIEKEVPNVLLFRARRDQELMPFAIAQDGREYTVRQDSTNNLTAQRVFQATEEGQIVHIGELIRKIRESKQQSKSVNPSASSSTLTNNVLDGCPHPDCNWRTARALEPAAYQDLLERPNDIQSYTLTSSGTNPNNCKPSQTSTLDVFNTSGPNTLLTSYFTSHHPTPSVNTLHEPRNSNTTTTSYLHQQRYTQPQQPNTNPIIPNSETYSNASVPAPALNSYPNPQSEADLEIDQDFNWHQWDELFGPFGGFGDMDMDMDMDLLIDAADHDVHGGEGEGDSGAALDMGSTAENRCNGVNGNGNHNGLGNGTGSGLKGWYF